MEFIEHRISKLQSHYMMKLIKEKTSRVQKQKTYKALMMAQSRKTKEEVAGLTQRI